MKGRIVIMGSGELAPGLVATHRNAIARAGAASVTILDSPYGFQENADLLTERIAEFFATSLRIPAEAPSLRLPGRPLLEVETMIATVRRSRYVFSGPGAPSHALRVWSGTGLATALEEVVVDGGSVCFASAASLTLGARTIPVYQIYKVGDAPHWHTGLGLMGRLGMPMTVIPHWNNAEGGTHDTSRCYIGLRRLRTMARHLEEGILGVDEHTAATLDLGSHTMEVTGAGGVSVIGPGGAGLGDGELRVESGATMDLDELRSRLGSGAVPSGAHASHAGVAASGFHQSLRSGDADGAIAALLEVEASSDGDPGQRSALRSMIVELGRATERGLRDPRDIVAPFVETLLETRQARRSEGDWAAADLIRDALENNGIAVRDTGDGVEWDLIDTTKPRPAG